MEGLGLKAAALGMVDNLLDHLAKEKMKEHPELPYHAALKQVARERPDLDKRRTRLQLEGALLEERPW